MEHDQISGGFLPFKVEMIKQVPLSSRRQADTIMWTEIAYSDFIGRSVYYPLIMDHRQRTSEIYKFWLKQHHFYWQQSQNVASTIVKEKKK